MSSGALHCFSFSFYRFRFLFALALLAGMGAYAQPISGVWRGKMVKGSGLRQSTGTLEVKLVKQGDSIRGTVYYYNTPKSFIRYSIQGYFDPAYNTVHWQDYHLIDMKPERTASSRGYSQPMRTEADFSCPDGRTLRLDGKSNIGNEAQFTIELRKMDNTFFSDEWDPVIEGYFTGMAHPDIIDSVWAIASVPTKVKDPTTMIASAPPVLKETGGPPAKAVVNPGLVVTSPTKPAEPATALVRDDTGTAVAKAIMPPANNTASAPPVADKPATPPESLPPANTTASTPPVVNKPATPPVSSPPANTTASTPPVINKPAPPPVSSPPANTTASTPPVVNKPATTPVSSPPANTTASTPPVVNKPAPPPVSRPPANTTASTPPVVNNPAPPPVSRPPANTTASTPPVVNKPAPPPVSRPPANTTASTPPVVNKPATPPVSQPPANTTASAPPIVNKPATPTPIQTPPKETPPIAAKPIAAPVNPVMEREFAIRKKIVQTEIPALGDSIELRFYDNAEVDGDSISLFLNGKMLFQHVRLDVRPYVFRISVADLPAESELTMVAENLGAIPPNTAFMEAFSNGQRYTARLESTEVTSAVIRLVKRE